MAYSRMGKDSDVYVYRAISDNKFVCCSCRLHNPNDRGDVRFDEELDLLSHLGLHLKKGQKVPNYTIQRIVDEAFRK